MSGDETFLESFLDSLSGLPHEIKRNLELMKDLDKSCSAIQDDMRKRQRLYVHQAEQKVLSLEVVVPPSPSPAPLTAQTTTTTTSAASGSSSSSSSSSNNPQPQQQLQPGVRVMKGGEADSGGGGGGGEVIIPTTEELMEMISQPEALHAIRDLEGRALQQTDEKVAIADQTYNLVNSIVKRLDADLENMEKILQTTGEFQAAGAAKPDDLAAIQVAQGSDWILAKVISHDPNTGMYKLSDEDVESSKIFNLPESQVVVLGGVDKLGRGDVIFAVYPDTTAFYQATVVQAPRKSGAGGSFVMVNFVDDSDEHGITHDKAVPIRHVMLPPYGATLQ